MDKEILNKAQQWLDGNYDEKTKKEIRHLINTNDPELENAFYQNLEFGTGGLRGVIGVGTNKMNIYTVGMATQGFANYIKTVHPIFNNHIWNHLENVTTVFFVYII